MIKHRITQRRRNRHRNTYKKRRQQKGGSGHIYTIPIELLYDSIYELGVELVELRSKCNAICVQKQCAGSSDPVVCEQTRKMMHYNNVYEIGNFCHIQLVRMTDPTSAQCQGASPSTNCICDSYLKKYKDLEKLIADIDFFLTNYHMDTPVKRYVQAVRDAGQTIRNMLDNFNMGSQLRAVPPELKVKTINDIMQTQEFKDALRAAIITRPISAPSRLESTTVPAAPADSTTLTSKSRFGFAPKTIARRQLLSKANDTMSASARVFNSLSHMNN